MKKLTALFLAAVMMLSLLGGCTSEDNPSDSAQEQVQTTPTPTPKQYFQNPLTGEERTSDYPEGKSPVAVMVNNIMSNSSQNAWPQSGLCDADIIYEMETEGGITRYMAVYSDYANMPVVGPVRSARDQFVQLMIPLQALYAHVGGSSYAKNMLNLYGWSDRDIDGYSKTITFLDEERALYRKREHCSYTNAELITSAVERFNLSDESPMRNILNWVKYDEEARIPSDGSAQSIYWRFSTIYDTFFTYHEDTQTYTKEHRYIPDDYKQPLVDANYNNKLVEFDNVLVLWTQIEKYPDSNKASGYSTLSKVDMDFGGIGYYFSKGSWEKVRWMKGVPTNFLRIVDAQGHETDVEINTGKTYLAFVDLDYFGTFQINDEVLDKAGEYAATDEIEVSETNQEEEE